MDKLIAGCSLKYCYAMEETFSLRDTVPSHSEVQDLHPKQKNESFKQNSRIPLDLKWPRAQGYKTFLALKIAWEKKIRVGSSFPFLPACRTQRNIVGNAHAHEEVSCLPPSSPFLACNLFIKPEGLELSGAVFSVRGTHQQIIRIG